ncbi:tyrosine-type recombinase/integrase [Rummeliibacillus sp. NPDC094406]|uniref:tyrosine-type recombinase/integrase n=1 Tax=Rummeliibacillus sp. NPDC094406 TaxID=3364511 RepID=UPI003803E419
MRFVEPIRDKEQLEELTQYLKDHNQRDYIMWMIGIHIGIRISDILNLRVKDVRKQTHLKIFEQKTQKYKRVIIPPKLRKELEEFIKGKKDKEFLIISRQRTKTGKQRAISRKTAWANINKAAQEIGYREKIGTHSMRKTFGYHYYKKFNSVGDLMVLFNHAEEATTLRYIGIVQDQLDANMSNLY